MATTCVLTYYCTLIGLSIFYLGSSLYPTLPWTDCDEKVVIPMDKVCLPSKPVLEAKNLTRQDFPLGENQSIMTSAEQFFTYGVLKSRPDNDITDGLGLPDPTLLGALAVTWIILYFSLRGGVGGQGKVVETIDKTLGIIFSNRLLTLRPFSPTWSFSLSLSGD